MNRHVGQAAVRSGKSLALYVAENMQHKGYYRLIDAIEPGILQETIERVQAAVRGTRMLSKDQEKMIASIVITSMDHTSVSDAARHVSVAFFNDKGEEVCNAHVPKDENQQEPARDK